MAFSIEFTDDPIEYLDDDPSIGSAVGLIVIGEFEENFSTSLYEWTKEDYQHQWRAAINTILRGEPKSALIVSYVNPKESSNLEWWPLYRVGDQVFFQDHLLIYEQLDQPFDLSEANSFVRDRKTINEDGNRISECLSAWMICEPSPTPSLRRHP